MFSRFALIFSIAVLVPIVACGVFFGGDLWIVRGIASIAAAVLMTGFAATEIRIWMERKGEWIPLSGRRKVQDAALFLVLVVAPVLILANYYMSFLLRFVGPVPYDWLAQSLFSKAADFFYSAFAGVLASLVICLVVILIQAGFPDFARAYVMPAVDELIEISERFCIRFWPLITAISHTLSALWWWGRIYGKKIIFVVIGFIMLGGLAPTMDALISQARQGGFGRLYDGWLWIILFVIGLRFAFIALASLTGLRGSYYLKGYLDGLENKKGGLELSVTASVFTLRDAEYLEGYYLGLRTASRASA